MVAYESEQRHHEHGESRMASGVRSRLDLDPRHASSRTADDRGRARIGRARSPKLGPIVNDAYFGAQPPERLRIGTTAVFFRGDGTRRGKIGMARPRVRDVAGSYDPDRRLLTIVQFTLPDAPTRLRELDVGPSGSPVRRRRHQQLQRRAARTRPAAARAVLRNRVVIAGRRAWHRVGSMRHVHRTVHVQGSGAALDAIPGRSGRLAR